MYFVFSDTFDLHSENRLFINTFFVGFVVWFGFSGFGGCFFFFVRGLFLFNVHWVNEPTGLVDTESESGCRQFLFCVFSFFFFFCSVFLKTEQCYRLIAYGSQLMS